MSDVRQQSFDGEIKKCPNCGSVVKSFSAFCSDCGHEFKNLEQSKAVKEFTEKLERLQSTNATKQIIGLIETFSIPNSKEDLLEFLILASSNIDDTVLAVSGYKSLISGTKAKKKIVKAWIVKYEQAYSKAKMILQNTKEFSEIQEINVKIEKKIRGAKRKRLRRKLLFWGIPLVIFSILPTVELIKEYKENRRLASIPNERHIDAENFKLTGFISKYFKISDEGVNISYDKEFYELKIDMKLVAKSSNIKTEINKQIDTYLKSKFWNRDSCIINLNVDPEFNNEYIYLRHSKTLDTQIKELFNLKQGNTKTITIFVKATNKYEKSNIASLAVMCMKKNSISMDLRVRYYLENNAFNDSGSISIE